MKNMEEELEEMFDKEMSKVEVEDLFPKKIRDGLGVVQLARLKKEVIGTIDDLPSMVLHSWMRVPAGSVVGLLDSVDVLERRKGTLGPHLKVEIYVTDGTYYHYMSQSLSNLELIEEDKK